MTLVRYRPFNNFDALQQHFEDFWKNFELGENDDELVQQVWKPRVDIIEEDGEYKVMADLPGMNKENVNITLEDNVLTINGERNNEFAENQNCCYLNERAYGKFKRSFNLHNIIDTENINASFEDGVLTITLPKLKAALPRKIEIKS